MEMLLLIARLLLALVFGVAAVAKMADRAGSRAAIIEFGVPERLASGFARLLPVAEALVALALIPLSTAWWGSVAALALLAIFTIGIGASLARGQSPDCRCFGQIHSEPVSWTTLARNLALVSIAGLIVAEGRSNPGLSALNWLNELRIADLINLAFGVLVMGLLVAVIVFLKRLLARQAELFDRVEALKAALNDDDEIAVVERKEAALPAEGLPVGAIAPKFALATLAGNKLSLDDLLGRGKSVLLLFVGPNCWGCKVLLPVVRAWQQDFGDRLTIAALSSGTVKENRDKMVKYEIDLLLLDEGSDVADEYQARWTPAAILIRPDGKIASQNTFGDNAIREMLRDIVSSDDLTGGLTDAKGAAIQAHQVSVRYSVRKIGELAPRFSLSDLTGRAVDAADLLGSPTLLIFWHPLCEFCNAMSDDLKRLEAASPVGAPKLVFIASGEVEDVRAMNEDFKSLTLLDPAFEIGPLFGTKFTPSAILIDEEGRIASSLAMGDPNVRALVGLKKAEAQATAHV